MYPEPGWREEKLPLLEDIMAGRATARTHPDQVTAFRSGSGIGFSSLPLEAKVLELERKRGVGHEIPMDWLTRTLHT